LGDRGATYDDHLRHIVKHVVDFLLVLTELLSLGVTAEALRAIIGSKAAISLQRGSADPKFQIEGVAPTNHSFSQKTRIYDLSYGIKIWSDFFRFVTMHTFDRRADRWTARLTDRILIARPRLHSMQCGRNAGCWEWRSANMYSMRKSVVSHPAIYRREHTSDKCRHAHWIGPISGRNDHR